jgi:hypothetical protein
LPSVEYFRLLVFSSYIYPLTIIFNGVLLGTGNAAKQLKLEVIKKILSLTGLMIGFYFGMYGFLIAMAVTSTINLILSFWVIKQILDLSVFQNIKDVFLYTVPLFVSYLLIELINYVIEFQYALVSLVINSLVFLVGYLIVNYWFKFYGFVSILGLIKKNKS